MRLPPLLIALTLLTNAGLATAEALPDLLSEVEQSPALRSGQAAVARTQAQVDRNRAEHGWQLFGSAGAGRFDEPVAEGIDRRYSTARATVGIQRPLLGANEDQRREILAAEGEQGEAEHLYQADSLDLQRDVAEAYARYWHAQHRKQLGRATVAVEAQVDQALAQRRESRMMRADEQGQLLQWLDGAHIDLEEAEIEADEAELALQALLNRTIRMDGPEAWFNPEWQGCAIRPSEMAAEVQALRARLESTTERKRFTRYHAVQSNLQLAYSATYEDDVRSQSDGLEVVWTVSVPFGALRGDNALRRELQAEQHELEHRIDEARAQVEQRYSLAERRLAVQKRRLQARASHLNRAYDALTAVQERSATHRGRNWEEWLPAWADYYQAAANWLEAALDVWLAQIECDQLTTAAPHELPVWHQAISVLSNGKPEETPAPEEPAPSAEPLSAPVRVYLWESEPVITGEDDAFWTVVRRTGITHLWISLDADQITRYGEHPQPLESFLAEARSRGITTGLLLGEPLWTLPEYRDDLLGIIQALSDLPFDDLHLDIEIDQLDVEAHGREALLSHWVNTLSAAANQSDWPLSVSAHPRDFDARGNCLSCKLAEAGVTELALMIYTTNPADLVSRVRTVAEKDSDLTLTLAQSVEQVLPEKNSWFHHGWPAFQEGMAEVREQMGQTRLPIAIQSYTDLRAVWADEDKL